MATRRYRKHSAKRGKKGTRKHRRHRRHRRHMRGGDNMDLGPNPNNISGVLDDILGPA